MKEILVDRLSRCRDHASILLSPAAEAIADRPWLALTSSHLGRSTRLHAEICRYIGRSLIDARQAGRVLLIAEGSAVEPWAKRAADLFSVPLIMLRVAAVAESTQAAKSIALQNLTGPGRACIDVTAADPTIRDEMVIALADRVDCVFTRPGGNIDRALRMRLSQSCRPTVRVAVHEASLDRKSQMAARELMAQGAIGWYCRASNAMATRVVHDDPVAVAKPARWIANNWARSQGQWLVHCTRACDGPWPGQTERQHRDALLLGTASQDRDELDTGTATLCQSQNALDTLRRIVRMRRLVASSRTTDRTWPVVCFSEQPLASLLAKRSYRPHLQRWDYEPYGVAIRTQAALSAGFQPVIYGTSQDRDRLPASHRYRYQAIGKTYDWRAEREWRCAGHVDLDQFDRRDVRIFVADESDARRIADRYEVSVVNEFLSR